MEGSCARPGAWQPKGRGYRGLSGHGGPGSRPLSLLGGLRWSWSPLPKPGRECWNPAFTSFPPGPSSGAATPHPQPPVQSVPGWEGEDQVSKGCPLPWHVTSEWKFALCARGHIFSSHALWLRSRWFICRANLMLLDWGRVQKDLPPPVQRTPSSSRACGATHRDHQGALLSGSSSRPVLSRVCCVDLRHCPLCTQETRRHGQHLHCVSASNRCMGTSVVQGLQEGQKCTPGKGSVRWASESRP